MALISKVGDIQQTHAYPLSLAPMMGYTDQHMRYMFRLLCPHLRLYSEMVTSATLIHSSHLRQLKYHSIERPIALQIGGSDPEELIFACRLATAAGFSEINLNVGCPSAKVQHGAFGACLMRTPGKVADAVNAMNEATRLPVTVKSRIGVDGYDHYDFLAEFIGRVKQAGCQTFIIHARKACLQGLSPEQNRHIPPLRYDYVYRVKKDFPELSIIINGGIDSEEKAVDQMNHVDGIMIGRAAISNPFLLPRIEKALGLRSEPIPSADTIIDRMHPYIQEQMAQGMHPRHILRPLSGLLKNKPGSRRWRQILAHPPSHPKEVYTVIENLIAFTRSI